MKKILVFCVAVGMQAMSSFGATNSVAPAAQANLQPKAQAQKPALAPTKPAQSGVPAGGNAYYGPAYHTGKLVAFQEVREENELQTRGANNRKASEAALESIFRTENEHVADSSIHSPNVTIFPPGR